MNFITKTIVTGILGLGITFSGVGCASSANPTGTGTITPVTFNISTATTNATTIAQLSSATYLSTITDPTTKTKLAQEMYSVAFATNQAVQSGGSNLNQITALINTIVNKNTNNGSRLGAGLLVNALSLYVQQQLSQNSTTLTSNQQAQDTILLVSAACQGVMNTTISYVNPSSTQPSLTDLAGQ